MMYGFLLKKLYWPLGLVASKTSFIKNNSMCYAEFPPRAVHCTCANVTASPRCDQTHILLYHLFTFANTAIQVG